MLPFASCSTYVRVPCSTPASPVAKRAAWRPAVSASPPASTPISRTDCVRDERVEDAERVAAAADARDDGIGQAAGQRLNLLARLAADHRLKLADHQRIGMRPEHRAEQVIAVGDVRHPVAHRFVDGVLQRPAARRARLAPSRRAAACGRRSAPGAPCRRRPCRRRIRGRAARRPWPWRRRAGRRRSRR